MERLVLFYKRDVEIFLFKLLNFSRFIQFSWWLRILRILLSYEVLEIMIQIILFYIWIGCAIFVWKTNFCQRFCFSKAINILIWWCIFVSSGIYYRGWNLSVLSSEFWFILIHWAFYLFILCNIINFFNRRIRNFSRNACKFWLDEEFHGSIRF